MFQYITASNYYISLLWGVLMETQVVVAYFSAPPKFFSGSATVATLLQDCLLQSKNNATVQQQE